MYVQIHTLFGFARSHFPLTWTSTLLEVDPGQWRTEQSLWVRFVWMLWKRLFYKAWPLAMPLKYWGAWGWLKSNNQKGYREASISPTAKTSHHCSIRVIQGPWPRHLRTWPALVCLLLFTGAAGRTHLLSVLAACLAFFLREPLPVWI